MRQWLIDPRILCTNHLLGEHAEHHMFLGVIKRKYKLNGYVEKNCLATKTLATRHEELANEMIRRNMKHNSPYVTDHQLNDLIVGYPQHILFSTINILASVNDLFTRCTRCRDRYVQMIISQLVSQVHYNIYHPKDRIQDIISDNLYTMVDRLGSEHRYMDKLFAIRNNIANNTPIWQNVIDEVLKLSSLSTHQG